MRVIKVAPRRAPVVLDTIPSLDFIKSDLNANVLDTIPMDESVGFVYDGQSREKKLPYNRALWEEGEIYDIIRGTFYVVAEDEDGNVIDLDHAQTTFYKTLFSEDERYALNANNELMCFIGDNAYIAKERD